MGKTKQNQPITSIAEFFYYAFRNILLVCLPLLVISGFVLSHLSFSSSATDSSSGSGSTDSFTVSISSACTISSVVNSIHNIETNVGTYVADVGKTTIKTLCNDGNGYSIYANGYSNNEEGNNKLINSEYPQYSIDTGLATSGLTSAWAMKLNNIENDPSPTPPVIESGYNNTYGLVPQYWTKVAGRTAGTTDMDEGSSFTTTYSVYASSNQHAGIYLGQVKYVLTHPSYQPYIYYMQEVDQWKNLIGMEESVQAIDKRDGKSYWVTKLKDGHIWMTQNLDFDIAANTRLSSETTDLNEYNTDPAEGPYYYGYSKAENIIYWEPASTAATINFTGTSVSEWIKSDIVPYSASKTDDADTGHTSLGNYYNWTAAIASSYNPNTLANNNNPQNSICPKGWRLPNISNNEFTTLNNLYNNNSSISDSGLIISPLWFIRSGYIRNANLSLLSSRGFYWSSTVYNQHGAYALVLANNSVDPAAYDTSSNYDYGFSVRCVAK